MAEPPTIDDYTAWFHGGSLNSQEDAHRVLHSLASCIMDDDLEPFLNRLLSSSCHTTPLALELILSCKHHLSVLAIADLLSSQSVRTTFC